MENSERKAIKEEENPNEINTKEKGDSDDKFNQKMINLFKKGYVWRPIPTITHTVLCLLITGIIFIFLGIIILIYSSKITTIELRYDNNSDCENALKNSENKTCELNFSLDKKLEPPIFIYYQLENFYQNHRRYFKSKSIKQLKGNLCERKDVKDDCDPIITNKDLGRIYSLNNEKLNENSIAHPCGLIARSYFNDSYELHYKNKNFNENFNENSNENNENDENNNENNENNVIKTLINIYSDGIASKSDKKRFKNLDGDYKKIQWLDVEDERFMVWMRPAGLNNFRKIWGKINKTLEEGEYFVTVTNNYPVSDFKGKKSFVLSNVNFLGGNNKILGWSYIIVGGISFIFSILFWVGYKRFMNLNKEALENIKKEENKND